MNYSHKFFHLNVYNIYYLILTRDDYDSTYNTQRKNLLIKQKYLYYLHHNGKYCMEITHCFNEGSIHYERH